MADGKLSRTKENDPRERSQTPSHARLENCGKHGQVSADVDALAHLHFSHLYSANLSERTPKVIFVILTKRKGGLSS